MATRKSIIDIEVNDSDFKRFAQAFNEFKDTVKQQPNDWNKVNESLEAVDKTVSQMSKNAAKHEQERTEATKGREKAEKDSAEKADKTEKNSRQTATHWHQISVSAKTFAHDIGDATRSILKWSTLTTLFTGILGGGGLFGIARLANAAGNYRRDALGYGAPIGDNRAFRLNFGRIIDTDQFLGGINESMHDVTKRYPLAALGLSDADIKGKSPSDVAAMILPKIKEIADRTPEAAMAQSMKNYGLENFMSLTDFQRLRNTSTSELGEYERRFTFDRKSLNVEDSVAKGWQDFQVQLRRAGENIETIFIRGLGLLAPELEKLSGAITELLKSMLESPKLKEWISDLAGVIKEFSKYLTDGGLEKDFENFKVWLTGAATKVEEFAKWIADFLGPFKTFSESWKEFTSFFGGFKSDARDLAEIVKLVGQAFHFLFSSAPDWIRGKVREAIGLPEKTSYDSPEARFQALPRYPAESQDGGWLGALRRFTGLGYANDNKKAQEADANFLGLETATGLPRGFLDNVWAAESGRGENMVSKTGALGHFQFMPGTARQYGLDNPYDLKKSAIAAAAYYADLRDQFGGDIEKAVAAYNWGPGNVRKDIRMFGEDWKSHLPEETKQYLARVMSGLSYQAPPQLNPGMAKMMGNGGSNVTISIFNNTGGNAIVSTSQLPR